ncbi:methyltransferase domain-containing protein [Solidesulfovibrio aerotolerans]|nr:class I SAM-dependent methyltransferase [Solidesulfovibrio aerotolerans]
MDSPLPPPLSHIRTLLAALGPERIWRPVPAPDGSLLAPGDGCDLRDLEGYLGNLDVAGKTVADLGCNLGYFTFLARRCGATRVLGLDSDPEIIHIAGQLATLHRLTDVTFTACDFLRQAPPSPCDMALLIDFIGRRIITKGRIGLVATAAKHWGAHELFFTLRPIYQLSDLPASPDLLQAHYPGFVRGDAFYLADALAHALGPDWSLRYLTDGRFAASVDQRCHKAALLFTRHASR